MSALSQLFERLDLSDSTCLHILFGALQTLQEFLAKKTKFCREPFKSISIHFDQNSVIPLFDGEFQGRHDEAMLIH